MIKHVITLCFVCTAAVLPACAQDFGVWNPFSDPHRPSRFMKSLERVFANQSRPAYQKLPWAQAVERQIHRATPQGLIGLKTDYILPQSVPPVPQPIQVLYAKRIAAWQQAASKNPVLGRFSLKTPRPQDATRMSEAQTAHLTRFFQNAVTKAADSRFIPAKTEEFKHYLVRLTFQLPQEDRPFQLLLNCYTKEMFVVFGNADLPDIALEPLPSNVRYR